MKLFKKNEMTLENEMKSILTEMKDLDKNSEEYQKLVEHYVALGTLKSETDKKLSGDTKAILITNLLLGGAIILSESCGGLINSRAMSLLIKGRV